MLCHQDDVISSWRLIKNAVRRHCSPHCIRNCGVTPKEAEDMTRFFVGNFHGVSLHVAVRRNLETRKESFPVIRRTHLCYTRGPGSISRRFHDALKVVRGLKAVALVQRYANRIEPLVNSSMAVL